MARPHKPVDELLNQRLVVMMSRAEIDAIDDWMFARRIRSRGEAIRQLCRSSIAEESGEETSMTKTEA